MGASQLMELKKEILSVLSGDFRAFYSRYTEVPEGGEENVMVRCFLPGHTDAHASMSLRVSDGVWFCHACDVGGDVFKAVSLVENKISFQDQVLFLTDMLGIDTEEYEKEEKKKAPGGGAKKGPRPPIDPALVDKWHKMLMETASSRNWIHTKKGLTDDTLREHKIGWDSERNTIPVYDEHGILVNVRRYNSKKTPKIISYTSGEHRYGEARLYGLDRLEKDYAERKNLVIICAGEWDRLLLWQEGFCAVTTTAGESKGFKPEWVDYFKDKNVAVLYDHDEAGSKGGLLVSKALHGHAKSVKNVRWPDAVMNSIPGGDVGDWFVTLGNSAEDLWKLIKETQEYTETAEYSEPEPVQLGSMVEIDQEKLVNKRVRVPIRVVGQTGETFHAVTRFKVAHCPKLSAGKCYDCQNEFTIPFGEPEYIGSCMATDLQVDAMLRRRICKSSQYGVKIEILGKTTIKEFFASQQYKRLTEWKEGNEKITLLDGKKQEMIERKVYFRSDMDVKPKDYMATGYVKSHPRTQEVSLLVNDMQPMQDDFEQFKVGPEVLKHLKTLQEMGAKEIVEDLTLNVTRIYDREDVLMTILLTYLSPLWIDFNGERIRGWITTVILGDSGTGKSKQWKELSNFIGVGDSVSGLTSSRTGLIYGLSEHKQKGWQVRIGRYPANHRKILMVDECDKLSPEDIQTLGMAMEDGFVQVDRISSGGYDCQTRLIMMGNPRIKVARGELDDAIMDDHMYPCMALKGIFPKLIIRRIDLFGFASSSDFTDWEFLNVKYSEHQKSPITPEMMRSLVYWSWNMDPEDIIFEEEAVDAILRETNRLSKLFGYCQDIPIVAPSDFRNTLARASTAMAALAVSTDSSFSKLIVKEDHVMSVVDGMEKTWKASNCMLDKYSDIKKEEGYLMPDEYIKIRDEFQEIVAREIFDPTSQGASKDPKNTNTSDSTDKRGTFEAICYQFQIRDTVRIKDLMAIFDVTEITIQRKIKPLRSHHFLTSGQYGSKKTIKFIKFLRALVEDKETTLKIGPLLEESGEN